MVKTIANCFNFAFFSAPIAVPALANANGIVIHAPQKFSLITIYLLLTSQIFVSCTKFKMKTTIV